MRVTLEVEDDGGGAGQIMMQGYLPDPAISFAAIGDVCGFGIYVGK